MDVSSVRPSHSTLRETPRSTESNLPRDAAIAMTSLDGLIMLQPEGFGRRLVPEAGCGEV
jgi:hypothetical protein